MLTPKEEAERLARKCAEDSAALRFPHPIQLNARKVYVEETIKVILKSLPLAELIEVARAANNNPYKTIEAEIALQDLQQTGKIEL